MNISCLSRLTLSSLAISVVALSACGGSSEGGGGSAAGATQADIESVCNSICDRGERCGSSDSDCVMECLEDITNPGNIRKDFVSSYRSCIESSSCDADEDDCLAEVAGKLDPNWQTNPLLTRCQTRTQECDASDDDCQGAIFFTSAAQQKLEECLDLSCNAVGECLRNLV